MPHGGHTPNHPGDDRSGQLMRWATYASATTALFLVGLKLWAWNETASVAVFSSLVDSILDLFASLVTLLAVRHALTPADNEHRFGHGKAEPLAALAQSAFIAGSAVLLILEAGERALNPVAIRATETGVLVMVISIAATLALLSLQVLVTRRTGSVAIKADMVHYLGDLLPNLGVIATIILAGPYGFGWLDPVFGLLIGLYLIQSAWRVAKEALDMLMDRELPDNTRAEISQIAESHPGVRSIQDLRTRRSGARIFIQMVLEFPGNATLKQAHDVSDEVEAAIRGAFPMAEIHLHQIPHGAHDDELPEWAQPDRQDT